MFEIALSYLRQFEDQVGPGDDDPYVIVFAANLADTGLIPIPATSATLYGPYEVENVVGFPVPTKLCWGFDGQPLDIDDSNNPLILVGLMESDHDDSPPNFANSVRTGTQSMVLANLTGYITARNAGSMDLATLRNKAINDMQGGLDIFRKVDIEHDERLGPVQLLPITAQDLIDAQSGVVEKKLRFVSHEEETDYELTFKIGTGIGSVSSALSSSGPTDRYAAIWVKESGAEWAARHRMTSEEYQQEFEERAGQGFRLVHISGYNFAGKVHFAAIWEKSAGAPWVARHDMTSEKYQEEFEKFANQGYRLVQVSGYRGLGEDLYAAIWRKEAGPAWVARHRMTPGKYQQEFNQLTTQGFRLVDVSGYRIANEERYAAIWEKKTDSPWMARNNMTSRQYQKEFNKLTNEGYRLVHVSGSSISGKRKLAAIWDKSSGPAWVARHDMTSEKYQEEFEKFANQGYRLVQVSGY